MSVTGRGARATSTRTVVVALGVTCVLTLGTGAFVAVGARFVRPMRAGDVIDRYRARPEFGGLPGWTRPLTGRRPPAGVYTYDTDGFSRINRPGVTRRYPAVTGRIVTHGPGCQWRETVPLFVEHVETYSACATAGDQLDTGFGTRLSYFFVPGTTDVVCSRPGTRTGTRLAPGRGITFACRDHRRDVSVTGDTRFLGMRQIDVGAARVACREVRVTTVLRGTTEGVAVRTLCTTDDTGVVVTEQRNVGITARSAFIGTVVYTEQATFRLRSLAPRT